MFLLYTWVLELTDIFSLEAALVPRLLLDATPLHYFQKFYIKKQNIHHIKTGREKEFYFVVGKGKNCKKPGREEKKGNTTTKHEGSTCGSAFPGAPASILEM